MIDPMRNKLSSGVQAEIEEIDTNWRKMIKEVILDSEVDLQIQLGTTEITGERLLYMQEGDVIQLDNDASEPLSCFVDGLEKMTGYIGIQRGFQAYQIKDKIITDCEN
jgi:flagellar motor switch protein FliM